MGAAGLAAGGEAAGVTGGAGTHEPVIAAFLCAWCAYRAADAAGTARTPFPPGLRPVRVPCTGRVDPGLVLAALRDGADGVLVAGCHPGSCHYVDGNLKALRRHRVLLRLLAQLGVEPERLALVWASAAEGGALAAAAAGMSARLRELGPLRRGGGPA